MGMTEHKRTADLHSKLKKRGKLRKIWKINDNYQGGVPDAFYLNDNELWVEYKNEKALPKRPTTLVRLDLSEQQFEWLEDLQAAGKKAYAVLTWGERNEARAWVCKDLERIRAGVPSEEVAAEAITLPELLDWIEDQCTRSRHSTRIPDDSFGNGY